MAETVGCFAGHCYLDLCYDRFSHPNAGLKLKTTHFSFERSHFAAHLGSVIQHCVTQCYETEY